MSSPANVCVCFQLIKREYGNFLVPSEPGRRDFSSLLTLFFTIYESFCVCVCVLGGGGGGVFDPFSLELPLY